MDRFDFCRALARNAGTIARDGFGRVSSTLKGRHDVVTEKDREVERFIRSAIAVRYPDDAIIGEEEGGVGGERCWLIDPIDGTANYARGIPRYCVSIGYVECGSPVIGVVYDPSADRLYAAARGDGAWCDALRMQVSDCARLDAAVVECGWSTRRSSADYVAMVTRVLEGGCAIRRAGSGALGLADVAAGRAEGYCELHINAWDCAAGILLVREAGGFTNDFFDGSGLVAGNPIIATNAALRDPLEGLVGIAVARRPGAR